MNMDKYVQQARAEAKESAEANLVQIENNVIRHARSSVLRAALYSAALAEAINKRWPEPDAEGPGDDAPTVKRKPDATALDAIYADGASAATSGGRADTFGHHPPGPARDAWSKGWTDAMSGILMGRYAESASPRAYGEAVAPKGAPVRIVLSPAPPPGRRSSPAYATSGPIGVVTVHAPETPRNAAWYHGAGVAAFVYGLSVDAAPTDVGDDRYDAWIAGWRWAKKISVIRGAKSVAGGNTETVQPAVHKNMHWIAGYTAATRPERCALRTYATYRAPEDFEDFVVGWLAAKADAANNGRPHG